ncbi:MAG: tyrosine-type recombinase/integrase [Endomicrobium sp.]|nr:tyrosine-type recombinase/integrase [Endomicrobium sp.]
MSVIPKHDFTPKDNEFRTTPLNQYLKGYLKSLYAKVNNQEHYVIGNENNIRTRLAMIQLKFSQLFKKANIKNATFHTLRHTCALNILTFLKGLAFI